LTSVENVRLKRDSATFLNRMPKTGAQHELVEEAAALRLS
jgi:hypothetical protein